MAISIPLIRNIQKSNKNSKFSVYEKALIDNAKLYTDSYSDDMFGRANYGCKEITFDEMKKKMLSKDIQEKDVTCNNPQTFVRVIKLNDKYTYETHVSCTTKEGKILYSADNIKSKDIDCVGGAISSGPVIEITPNKSPVVKVDNSEKNKTVKVTVVSSYGVTAGSSFYYAWSYDENGENLASNWKQQMLGDAGIDVPGYRKAFDFNTNQLATGTYYLLIRIVDNNGNYVLKDAAGNTNETTLYHAGPYVVDKTAPDASSATVTSTTSWNHKEIKFVAGGANDNINGTNLRVCLSQNDSCTNFVTPDKAKLTLSGVSYNGANVSVNIFIKDLAGNQTKKTVTYKMYQECLDANLVMTTVKSTGACSKVCDGGTRTDVYNTKDKTSGNACSKTLNKTGVACNTMGCCSATNTTYSAWSGWGGCSASCGNSGTQSRTRTKYVKSNYSGQICSQNNETETQACNRRDCCSSKKIGSYGNWSGWGGCSASCGSNGVQYRTRTRYYVSNYNGQSCGSDTETGSQACNRRDCCGSKKIGSYGSWSGWSSCSASCGGGTQSRSRTRYYVSNYNGQSCGSDTEKASQACNTHSCTPSVNCYRSGPDTYFDTNNGVAGRWYYFAQYQNRSETYAYGYNTSGSTADYPTGYGKIVTHSNLRWVIDRSGGNPKARGQTISYAGAGSNVCGIYCTSETYCEAF